MNIKKRFMLSALFFILLGIGFVSGITASFEPCSSCEAGGGQKISQVTIEDAINLYSYEINFDLSGDGEIMSNSFQNFLGSDTSGGTTGNSTFHTAYQSILNSSSSGVNGTGLAFYLTYNDTLTVTLNSAIFVFADGTEETISFLAEESGGSSGGGGGGGGGGGSTTSSTEETTSITVFPKELEVTVVEGESKTMALSFTNDGSEETNLTISLGSLASFINIEESTITLSAGERKAVNFEFIPKRAAGIITGSIKFYEGTNLIIEVPVTINIRSENFLFDVTITNINSNLGPDEVLRTQIDLVQSGEDKEIELILNYMIKNFADEIFYTESETRKVTGHDSFIKETDLSGFDLPFGSYIFGIEASYEGELGTTSARFEVSPLKSPRQINKNLIIGIAAGLLVLTVVTFLIVKYGRNKGKIKRKN